jgi:hypothetical protein
MKEAAPPKESGGAGKDALVWKKLSWLTPRRRSTEKIIANLEGKVKVSPIW